MIHYTALTSGSENSPSEFLYIQKGIRNNYLTPCGKINLPGFGTMTGENLNAQFVAYCMEKELR